ncbi:YcxB family protein [Rufibacter roseus]|uniref:YcxB family protein n=1 Tax=Rufibacter roseus TaxID=1567108 RepID=A0ABW2DM99_9BACT|nr:YcxB family protein [Rufibacter roseus]
MQGFTINTQLSTKNYIQFTKQSKALQLLIWFTRILGFFLLLSVPLHYASEVTSDLPFPWAQLLVGLVMVAWPFLLFYSVKRSFLRNTSLQETITYTFTEQEMQVQGETFTSRVKWKDVYRIQESRDLLIVWHNPQVANIIPKKYLKPEELSHFYQLANRRN